MQIDTVIYFTITDPRAASYEIANPLQGIEQLTVTTLRNIVGSLTLEEALTGRERVNTELRVVLDERTGKWGIRVNGVELKSIDPPASIQEAMEKQMRAERDRRATILTAEGVKQSQILTAEGEKHVVGPARRGRAGVGDPARRGRGEGDRDGLRRDPRGQARPGAAQLPVPADAAADRPGRRQQGLGHPERGHAGAGEHRRRRAAARRDAGCPGRTSRPPESPPGARLSDWSPCSTRSPRSSRRRSPICAPTGR